MVYHALGQGTVPDDLFPNEPKRAYELISKDGYQGQKM